MAAAQAYPVRVDASLDAPLSRWLWLVKWVLVIPHYVVLAFLWAGFVVLSAVAMVAIVVTGRYPRAIFEFNVGVLRWTWRVQYYAIGAFGTDRYPPFTLAEDPSYPAHLEVDYPQRLSRGLALVKWWLLAIPQYIIVGLFTGSGLWFAWQLGEQDRGWAGLGLIGILAVIAAVVLLVTGRYPEQIFDFVLGMNRWVLRVAGYAGLMTDEYPPFRLDMGGHDPGTLTLPPAALQDVPGGRRTCHRRPGRAGGWTGGRIVSVVAGAVLVLCSLGLLGGGGVALWAQTNRHGGYADLATATYSVPGYAIASDRSGCTWPPAPRQTWSARCASASPRSAGPVRRSSASPRPARRPAIWPAWTTRPSAARPATMAPTPSTPGPRLRSRRGRPASGPGRRPGREPRHSPGRSAAATGWWWP